jgi:hypothetical protein
MKRVYALHLLAQKFSPDDEARLDASDLKLLHQLTRQHIAALTEKIGGMEQLLVPTLSSLGGMAAAVPAANHMAWQPAAEDVFRSARRAEVLISQMLGMTPGSAPIATLPSDLMAAMKELQANLGDCQKTLK